MTHLISILTKALKATQLSRDTDAEVQYQQLDSFQRTVCHKNTSCS